MGLNLGAVQHVVRSNMWGGPPGPQRRAQRGVTARGMRGLPPRRTATPLRGLRPRRTATPLRGQRLTQRRQDAKKEVPLLVAQGKEFPINSLLPISSQGRRWGRGMRWVNTRSLCFANRMDFEKYPPDLARDCIAAGSFKRCSVLFPPSSPPPLAPALREKGGQEFGANRH